jgi:glutaconate CoA-transferase subunit B
MADYTPNEMMTIAAARALKDDDVCFVGIGMPSAAANLARLTHAPNITLIYESGTLATKPNILPLSIGDGELCETAITTVSVPEMFRYWLQGGRIKVGFLGGAQIDKFANLNTTVVGPYDKPKVRLPGGGGAPEIATSCGEIFIIMARASELRRQARFRHLDRSCVGGRQPKQARSEDERSDQTDHRSRHSRARPDDERNDRRFDSSGRHA